MKSFGFFYITLAILVGSNVFKHCGFLWAVQYRVAMMPLVTF